MLDNNKENITLRIMGNSQVDSTHKRPVMRKPFSSHDIIMFDDGLGHSVLLLLSDTIVSYR